MNLTGYQCSGCGAVFMLDELPTYERVPMCPQCGPGTELKPGQDLDDESSAGVVTPSETA